MIRVCATVAVALVLLLSGVTQAAAPKVVATVPDAGDLDVDPAVKEIRVEFDQPMNPVGRSIVGGGAAFPKIAGQPKWLNPKAFVVPVTLEPGHEYALSVNSDTFKGFVNGQGEPAEWYVIRFKTRAAGAGPAAPDVTPEQNKQALAALQQAIDKDYAYRDRLKVDWTKEIDARRAKFESARTANAFARLAAQLLRLAEDAHVDVEAGDLRIGSRTNSAPPNINVTVLRQAVPRWTEHLGGVVTGRFDGKGGGDVGYVLFSQCSNEQAQAFDAALDGLMDTNALILDARLNGGGDEIAARRVAGRFVEKPAAYSKDRMREGGVWKGPVERKVDPRADAERYAKPVAVLIGPKVGSSAESFVLMMKHGAKATLVGEATKGSSGRPIPHPLGNGVTVYLPSWEDQTPDGAMIEGRGVQPDVVVKTTPRALQKSDPVLETALKLLRKD
jgi:hypothetical protein